MSNVSNSIQLLNDLKAVLTDMENFSAQWRTGNVELDARTRELLGTNIAVMCSTILDYGSRSTQNAAAASRQAVSGIVPAQKAEYGIINDFVNAITAHVNSLTNPTSVPRRSHVPLQ